MRQQIENEARDTLDDTADKSVGRVIQSEPLCSLSNYLVVRRKYE